MRCLKDIYDSQNATLFLGVIKKEEIGGCEEVYQGRDSFWGSRRWGDSGSEEQSDVDEDEDGDGDWHLFVDVFETEISIKKLVTADGRTMRENLTLTTGELEEKLIQDLDDPFGNATCGEKDYSGLTGNEGVSATHWYCMTVAVIVPNDTVDHFLIKRASRIDAQSLLPHYLAKCSDSETRESAMKIVRHLAHVAWGEKSDSSDYSGYDPVTINEGIALQFVAVILEHREYGLFSQAMDWFKISLNGSLFALIKKVAAEDSFDFNQVKDSLTRNLSLRSVAGQMKMLTLLGLPSDPSYNPRIGKWVADEVVPAAMAACLQQMVLASSGSAIVDMVKEFHDIEYLKTNLIPLIKNQVSMAPFALAALMRIIHLATEGVFDKAVTLDLCKPLLKSVFDTFSVTKPRTKEAEEASWNAQASRTRGWYAGNRNGPHQNPHLYISPSLLVECLNRCIQLGWDDLAMAFSFKIIGRIAEVPPAEFRYLWIPFVRELIPILDAANVPLSTPRYQELARAILEAYLDKQVGMEPSGAVSYGGQGPVRCRCGDCRDLNRFLASDQRVWHFPAAEKRHRHGENYVSSLTMPCSCNTERYGSPYTLVVTKKVDTGAKAKKDWADRYAQAWVEFSKFDQEKLQVLLGEDWERITTMKYLRIDQGGSTHVHSGPPPMQAHGNLVAGVKRRADE